MRKPIVFNPGPSQLYFTVEDHMRKAFREGIPSISHRSKIFEGIFQEAVNGLRELLQIPRNQSIVFTSSATEIWERIAQNLIDEHSYHFVNGAFSKRFYEIARQLGKHPEKVEVSEGEGFSSFGSIPTTELIGITQNETSTGVSVSTDFIHQFGSRFPDALIAVDAVSSLPYPALDFAKLDSVFFSVQKGFGLPPGLGVWIINDRCVAKAESILSKGKSIGTYHSIPSLVSHAKKNQTPSTPNVLGIYLLAKVVQDMLRRGIQTIRKETEYKAALLYQALDKNPSINPFVKDPSAQSKTVIVAECGEHTEKLNAYLLTKGLQAGEGYGSFKKQQLRFANFPAHSKEQIELLVDSLNGFNP